MLRLLFALLILGSLHGYVWARLVRDPALPPPWRGIATAAIVLFGISMPLSMLIGRGLSREAASWVAWPAFVWMGLLMFFTLLNASGDLVRVGMKLWGAPKDPERRLFLHRMMGGAVFLASAGLGAFAVRGALRRVRLRELEISLSRLPGASTVRRSAPANGTELPTKVVLSLSRFTHRPSRPPVRLLVKAYSTPPPSVQPVRTSSSLLKKSLLSSPPP